jgi:hypothetical protein
MAIIQLIPADGKKSFYGKCYVKGCDGYYALFSYGTPICEVNTFVNELTRFWGGYSRTTMRHVNAFMAFLGYGYSGKAWWDSLPVNSPVRLV